MIRTLLLTSCLLFLASCGIFNKKHHDDDAPPAISLTDDNNDAANLKDPALYRGYTAINQILNERLFSESDALTLAFYFDGKTKINGFELLSSSLRSLLGVFQGNGLKTGPANAEPNSMNLLLWYLAFDGLGKDLESQCGDTPAPSDHTEFKGDKLQPDVIAAMHAICHVEPGTNHIPDILTPLWNLVMHADAPITERDAWIKYASDEVLADGYQSGELRELFIAMTYNPHFLLKN